MFNLVSQFSRENLDLLAAMIDDDVQSVQSSRTAWTNSLVNVTRNYMSEPDDDYIGPWPNSSDAFLPLTMISVETSHPRILGGVVGLDEMVTAVPMKAATAPVVESVTRYMNYVFKSPAQMDIVPVLDKALYRSELLGRAYTMSYWDRRDMPVTRMFTRPRYQANAGTLKQILTKLAVKKISKKMLEVPYGVHLQDVIGQSLLKIVHHSNYSDRTELTFSYVSGGEIREGLAIIPIPDEEALDILMYIKMDETFKDSPSIINIPLLDIYQPTHINDVNEGKFITRRFWIDIEELHQMRLTGAAVIDDTVWREIVGANAEEVGKDIDYNLAAYTRSDRPKTVAAEQESDLRSSMARSLGDADETNTISGIEVLQSFYRLRMPGDPAPREYVIYYMPNHRTIYSISHLGIMCPDNRRPINAWEFVPSLDDSVFSMGLGHLIMDMQSIINDTFNNQIDRDKITSMPFGFYKPSAFGKGQSLNVSPGVLIPSNDPTAVTFPSVQRPIGADVPIIQFLISMTERLTSATNYFQGSSPSQPNAPRTFGATAAIIQEGQVNFESHVQRYQRELFNLARSVQRSCHHFMGPEAEFLAPGARELSRMSRADLSHDYGYVFKGNTANTNKSVRRELSAYMYQALVQNPLIATSPQALYNLTRRFAIAHDYLEFDHDIPSPAPEEMHAPMSQEEEIELMLMDRNVAPLPIDNHQQHIEVLTMYMSGEIGMSMSDNQAAMLVGHLQQHQQMAAMMQRMQMLQQGGVNPGAGTPTNSMGPTASDTGNPGAPSGGPNAGP